MCTVILQTQRVADQPIIVGFNRDEHYERVSQRPKIWVEGGYSFLAPVDIASNSTWIGINDQGLFVCLLNYLRVERKGTKSRGRLLVDILSKCADKEQVKEIIREQSSADFKPFTLIIGDKEGALLITFHEEKNVRDLLPGIYVFCDTDVFDNSAIHQRWLKNEISRSSFLLTNLIDKLPFLLSEHKSASVLSDVTCCHAEHSGTLSSQIVSLSQTGHVINFFHCETFPCKGNYVDYAHLMAS